MGIGRGVREVLVLGDGPVLARQKVAGELAPAQDRVLGQPINEALQVQPALLYELGREAITLDVFCSCQLQD